MTMSSSEELVPVDLVALMEDPGTGNPVVMLHDRVGKRILPIWIGDPEARAIDMALNKTKSPRPLTHRLLLNVTEGMGGKLSRVVISRVINHTYYATIYIQMTTAIAKIDSRPSDAIAIALEAGIPLLVDKGVMVKAGHPEPIPYLPQIEKREISREDFKRMGKLIEEARKREEKASNNNM